ncbi:hypothetical protein CPLU01_11759 [Colletotrichum plurivorum]|uniref:SWR1-complex protein 3 domain-containing protein n=1 Tax=Colletotrichum plurivorum TaxID=2175906 RepID=A0A8H6K184_9PEZI|nr:hypothetical protein CPLU01_11759 [Colletotrichum plurivorum]
MERKRKLPARAAARVEHVAKKRTVTPPEHRSVTPVQPPAEEPPVPSLPRSVQAGKPLPTVEDAQPEDLPAKEYQSFQESGVMAESLSRSKHRWMAEGIFEKYWTKPLRKKGATEDPKNPAKDTMSKIGQVTITIEPHVFEATMWAIKDPKPPAPTTQATFRPIMQYGPPNGAMPPPPTPTPTNSNPPLAPAPESKPTPPTGTPAPASPAPQQPPSRPPSSAANQPPVAAPSPRNIEPAPPAIATPPAPRPAAPPAPMPASAAPGPPLAPALAPAPSTPSYPASQPGAATVAPGSRPSSSTPTPLAGAAKPAPPKPQGTDPIIMTLAEKASEDPHLRDLMKRVAAGEAKPDELSNFQRIIDQITAEYKRKGGQQGPSADRLLVDGRTVKYFADEVRTILDIVLTTNPRQKSNELVAPRGSDPLVVALVKAALDDPKVRTMIRRIAENQPGFTDATDLKAVLDKLLRDVKGGQTPQPQPSAPQTPVNGVPNGNTPKPAAIAPAASPKPTPSPAPQLQNPPQQALRSKGPPPPTRPEISGVCLDFTGGNGDRYLFPKYSILEYLPGGQQVIASFLIVRKGSQLEYGGDAKLDYYQPVTVRLYAQSARHLEYLQRVVAPADEVRRYMDDVMDNMTRAEYVILAMRLPRGEREPEKEQNGKEPAALDGAKPDTPAAPEAPAPKQQPVMWGPAVNRFTKKFNKKWFEEWKKSGRPVDKRVSADDEAFYKAAEAVGRDPLDKEVEYEKMIELLAAKDAETTA